MFSIILKHVIGEVAINTFFDKVASNFRKPTLEAIFKDAGIVFTPYIARMREMSKDIQYFERMRDEANARTPGSGDRYANMTEQLKEAHGVYYKYVTLEELGSFRIDSSTNMKTTPIVQSGHYHSKK